jgi:cytochrome o ubiquinol oxidase subunit 1
MPISSAIGVVNAFFTVIAGFALVWHIWWMAALGLCGAFVALLAFAFRDEEEIEVPAEQIAGFERRHQTEIVL